MNSTLRSVTMFLVGVGIGGVAALLVAPQSGEKTRERIAGAANKKARFLLRKGQQSIGQVEDALAMGGDKVSHFLKSSKDALESVSAKLN